MQPDRKMWFPAKKYGGGWGAPCCWQGWIVLCVWVALTIAAVAFLSQNVVAMELVVAVMTFILVGICWWKGEKPKWRWGNK